MNKSARTVATRRNGIYPDSTSRIRLTANAMKPCMVAFESARKLIVTALLCICLLVSSKVFAETFEVIAEGEYVMGDGETMVYAEDRALKKAQQNAAEQAGAYVSSFTRVANSELTEDVIEVTANQTMKITVLEKTKSPIGNLEAIRFWVKIKARLSSEDVAAHLKKIMEDRSIVTAYTALKADFEKQAQEMQLLKKQLAAAGSADKQRVLTDMARSEQQFRAHLWLERAQEFMLNPERRIEAYTKAIQLDPKLTAAYLGRARAYRAPYSDSFGCSGPPEQCRKESESRSRAAYSALQLALDDINKAISIDAHDAELFLERASIREMIRDNEYELLSLTAQKQPAQAEQLAREKSNHAYHDEILDDLSRAIELKATSSAYRRRAWHRRRREENGDAIADLTNAIKVGPVTPYLYADRAYFYEMQQNIAAALADATKAIALCSSTAGCNPVIFYNNRGHIYFRAGNNEQAEKDYQSARELVRKNKQQALRDEQRSQQEEKEQQNALATFQKSPYGRMMLALLDGTYSTDEFRHLLAITPGSPEDLILRARQTQPLQPAINAYTTAINKLQSAQASPVRQLLLAATYQERASRFMNAKKQYDKALKDLDRSFHIISPHLVRAMKQRDAFIELNRTETKQPSVIMNRLASYDTQKAEDLSWLNLYQQLLTQRSELNEEMRRYDQAAADYQRLCNDLKLDKACKSAQRLQR